MSCGSVFHLDQAEEAETDVYDDGREVSPDQTLVP